MAIPKKKTKTAVKRNSPVAPGIYQRATKGFKAVVGSETVGYFKTIKQAITARTEWGKKLAVAA